MSIKGRILAFLLFLVFAVTVSSDDLSAVEQKASTCFVCHGEKGRSDDPQWPSLAGQQSIYIVDQLHAFKKGARANPVMQAQAGKLTAEDINNFGAYFAVQKPAKAGGDKALAKQGKAKATVCLGCHGKSGEGNGEFPRLGGQHPEYLAEQLTRYKNGIRKNAAMQAIAGNLSDEEIKALAAFFGAL